MTPIGDIGLEPILQTLLLAELHLNEEICGRFCCQVSNAICEGVGKNEWRGSDKEGGVGKNEVEGEWQMRWREGVVV